MLQQGFSLLWHLFLWLKTRKFVPKIKKATVDYGKISYGILKTREEGYVLGTYKMLLSAAISV